MGGGQIIADNARSYAIRDGFPVTELHTLIIPKRHTMTYFDLGQSELNSVYRLVAAEKQRIEELTPSVTAFNIGMNCGESGGQAVFHCHIHLIPRIDGDVDAPRGGVRHLNSGQG
jgi:ATP adenylyltransferase